MEARKRDEDLARRRRLQRIQPQHPNRIFLRQFERFIPIWVPRNRAVRYRVFIATATLSIAFLAYLRSNDSYLWFFNR